MNTLYQQFSTSLFRLLINSPAAIVVQHGRQSEIDLPFQISLQGSQGEVQISLLLAQTSTHEQIFLSLARIFDALLPGLQIKHGCKIPDEKSPQCTFSAKFGGIESPEIMEISFSGHFSSVEEQNMRFFIVGQRSIDAYLVVLPQHDGTLRWILQIDSLKTVFSIRPSEHPVNEELLVTMIEELPLDATFTSLPRLVLGTVTVSLKQLSEFLTGSELAVHLPTRGRALALDVKSRSVRYRFHAESAILETSL